MDKNIRMIGVTNFYDMITKDKIYDGRIHDKVVHFISDKKMNAELMLSTLNSGCIFKTLPKNLNPNTKTL